MKRSIRSTIVIVGLLFIVFTFNACMYSVDSNTGKLPVHINGAVYLGSNTLLSSIKTSGYYESVGAVAKLVCIKDDGHEFELDSKIVDKNFNYQLSLQSSYMLAEHYCSREGSQNNIINLLIKINGQFVPILTAGTMDCILKTGSSKVPVTSTTSKCLQKDQRKSATIGGFNKFPSDINKLKLYLYVNPEPIVKPAPNYATNRVVYMGKRSNITDFRGYGQHLYYFPAFGLEYYEDSHRTDDDAAYYNPVFKAFLHHQMFELNSRTFSPDAGGTPLGVKAKGGHVDWPVFTLPNGVVGLSGSIYDDATRDNSNNTVNQIKLHSGSPKQFCLNIITDNTNLVNIPDAKLVARSDQSAEDVSVDVNTDLKFDNQTDMYTFRYTNMTKDGLIKIQMKTNKKAGSNYPSKTGAGIAGIMISDISTCTP